MAKHLLSRIERVEFLSERSEVRNSGEGRNYPKAAFTLAECLITLGIIGVVAAITITPLIQKHKEQVTVKKVKKMYSTLANAYMMYENDGRTDFGRLPWSYGGAKAAFDIFKPYLNIVKDCGRNGSGCFYMGNYKWLNGSMVGVSYGADERYYKVLLADGAALAFRGTADSNSGSQFTVFYDVNGGGAPNTWGKDLFEFSVRNYKLFAFSDNEQEIFETCFSQSGNFQAGDGCAGWIVANGNIDYLHCKGLALHGPTSCKDLKK